MSDFLRVFFCFVLGLVLGAAAGYKHAPPPGERVDCRPILYAAEQVLELEGTTNEHLKLLLRLYDECDPPEAEEGER